MTMRLTWEGEQSFGLDLIGRPHGEILVWLHHVAVRKDLGDYEFDFDYHLEERWRDPERYIPDFDPAEAKPLAEMRGMADRVLNHTLEQIGEEAEVRIWPHHLDTAIIISGDAEKLEVGLGFAIPDKMIGEHYLYVAAYNEGKGLSTAMRDALSMGVWHDEEFKGATLTVSGLDEKIWGQFLIEAYKSSLL